MRNDIKSYFVDFHIDILFPKSIGVTFVTIENRFGVLLWDSYIILLLSQLDFNIINNFDFYLLEINL